MGKKRAKDKSSREEDDIDLSGPSCRHIKKGTEQTLLKKLSGNSNWTSCQDCSNDENKENVDADAQEQDSQEEQETQVAWLCLKCGHRGCGRYSENQHAIRHYETPRSDPHCLVINLDTWAVWCYICDDEVQYSKTGHLAQLISKLQKEASAQPIKTAETKVKEEDSSLEAVQKTELIAPEGNGDHEEKENNKARQKRNTKKESYEKPQKTDSPVESGGVSVKGLSNLGNTCFFNAVIQSLSQTHLLRQTLNKETEKRSLNIQPVASADLEPLGVHLDQPGSLTLAMCQLLNEIQETKKGVVTPRELFTQVCKKAARFKGFQQQDSQELLRYLLDGMRAEEIKRVNTGLMEEIKKLGKITDGEQMKKLVKEYERNGIPKNFVDLVFGGEMTSTIMCQQCQTVSIVTEMFLDLSLPVSDEAYRKKNQKKVQSSREATSSPTFTSGNDDSPSSKYQQKKAKKQAKKQAKQQKRQQKFESRPTLESLTSPTKTTNQNDITADSKSGEDPDTEVHQDASLSEDNPAQISVSEQDQENVHDSEEHEEDMDSVAESSSSVSNRFTVLADEQKPKEGSIEGDQTSDAGQDDDDDDIQIVDKMEKVNLDEAFLQDSDGEEPAEEGEEGQPEDKEYTVVNQDPALAFQTLASRSAPEKQECSVKSCLFQFTEVETLTQNNSLLCVTCTKRQPNKDKAQGSKNIYTDASKQMLISSPPPVLTLHLKRFQQNGYSICKVNRHVQFPLLLDLAPYCGVKCTVLAEGQTEILYSLYGIVEHSGTMRSGHYTAYVKVRPSGAHASSNGLAQGDAEAPRGSWFHISDTSVQPVSESKVQSCQAYLLFYERLV